MSIPRTRSDELLEHWAAATSRPTPDFLGVSARRRGPAKVVIAAAVLVALILAALATLAVGALLQKPKPDVPSAELAHSAAAAIATAPGVGFTLKIATRSPDGTSATNASGTIDFEDRLFSGTADGGDAGAPMSLFGGPASGAVVVADGLFVQTEGGAWVHVPELDQHLAAFVDRDKLSRAFGDILDASTIDPAIRFKPCGAESCRLITISAPPEAIYSAGTGVLGSGVQTPPDDFGRTTVELLIDPSSGFPVRLDTALTAGPTTTEVSLELERLDPAPTISPPIP